MDRRKRRKVSTEDISNTIKSPCPLPSPPDLKTDYESLTTEDKMTLKDSIFKSHELDIIHDPNCCIFKIQLDKKGNTAALCYLPTRYKNIVEFYHTEIPIKYRHQGLGDILLYKAFQWVEKTKLMVIPTCPFVRKYLETRFPDHKSGNWSLILSTEKDEPN